MKKIIQSNFFRSQIRHLATGAAIVVSYLAAKGLISEEDAAATQNFIVQNREWIAAFIASVVSRTVIWFFPSLKKTFQGWRSGGGAAVCCATAYLSKLQNLGIGVFLVCVGVSMLAPSCVHSDETEFEIRGILGDGTELGAGYKGGKGRVDVKKTFVDEHGNVVGELETSIPFGKAPSATSASK